MALQNCYSLVKMFFDPTSTFFDPFVTIIDTAPEPIKITGTEDTEETSSTGVHLGDEGKQFDPKAKPFSPQDIVSYDEEEPSLGGWQVVAAEFGGKAVAVLVVSGTDQVNVCTSPAFNSKCVHPGISCLDWDSFVFDPELEGETRETSLASQSPLPGPGSLDHFHDSGFENFTDNSSEVSGENLHQTGPGLLATVAEVSYSDLGYPQPDVVCQVPGYQNEASFYQPVEVYSPSDGFEQQALMHPSPSSPLVQYVPWVTEEGTVPSPVSWSSGMGLGAEMADINNMAANLDLGSSGSRAERTWQQSEDQMVRDSFKKQILSNIAGTVEESDEDKIRDTFKKKVLTNIKASEEEKDYEDMKKRRAFKKQILANLKNT